MAVTFACFVFAGCSGQTTAGGTGGSPSGGSSSGGAGAGGATGGAGGTGAGGSAGSGGTGAVAPSDGVVVRDESDQPIAGAIVVVDRTSGAEAQNTTDGSGIATFADVHFASEKVDITAFSPGRVLVTALDVDTPQRRIFHLLPRVTSAQWTRVLTVHFSNKVASGDCVMVSSTLPSFAADTCDASCDLAVAPGAPGKVLAFEYTPGNPSDPPYPLVAAVAVDIPGAGNDVDIDFSKSLAIEHASGTVIAPGSGSSPSPYDAYVRILDTAANNGDVRAVSSPTSLFASGKADWQADFFRPFPDAEAVTAYDINYGPLAYSQVFLPGYFVGALPPFPVPSVLDGPGKSTSVFAPFSWIPSADRPDRMFVLSGNKTLWFNWSISFSPTRTSLTLRKPPDSIWNALAWKDDPVVVPGWEYCDPVPDACAGRPCTPGDAPWCKRSTAMYPQTFYDFGAP